MKFAAVLFISSYLVKGTSARSWEDVIPFHGLDPLDASLAGGDLLEETDPFLFTKSPSMAPNLRPSASPTTSEPSKAPTSAPTITLQPTHKATNSPSVTPSSSPSAAPSVTPTSSPTLDEFPPNPSPSNAPNFYFNYDPSSDYGPGDPQVVYHNASMNKVQYFSNGWASVVIPDDGYWNEFGPNGTGPWQGVLTRHDPIQNRCGNVGKQSPIDVRPTGAECVEHHQIRSRVSCFVLPWGTLFTSVSHCFFFIPCLAHYCLYDVLMSFITTRMY